jgi:DHA2 family multidrug resistance protein-like MFS transporter
MAANISNRAGRREWLGLAVIALPCVLYRWTSRFWSWPCRLSADLKPHGRALLWIPGHLGSLVAGSLITMGTLGDRIGRRRLLMIGAAAFGIASVIAPRSRPARRC